MENLAEIVTKYLSAIIEILAAIVIAVALLQFLYSYVLNIARTDSGRTIQDLRIRFGSSLTVSLELLLGADILATAIAPTWDEIGKLAAIATLRTALNYFLERELKNSESNKRSDPATETSRSSTYPLPEKG